MIAEAPVRKTVLLVLSNGFKLGLGFVATMLLAKALPPADFGLYSLLLNIVVTISAIGDLGINWAFIRLFGIKIQRDPVGAMEFLRVTLGVRLVTSAALFLICILLLPLFSREVFGDILHDSVIRVGCLLIVFWTSLNFALAMLQAERKFESLSLNNLVTNVFRVAILGGLWMFDALTIMTAVLTFVVSMAISLSLVILRESTYRPILQLGMVRKWFRDFFFWGRWNFLHQVSNVVLVKLDVIILGYFSVSSALIGNYSLAFTLASVIAVLQTTMHTYLLPEASRIRSEAEFGAYKKTVRSMARVVLPVFLVLAGLCFPIAEFLYSEEYPETIAIMLPLIAAGGISLCAGPVSLLAFPLNRPQITAATNLIGIFFLVTSCVVLVPRYSALGAGISVLVSKVVSEGLTVGVVLRGLKNVDWEALPHPDGTVTADEI